MKVGRLENGLDTELVVIMKSGRIGFFPTNLVVAYRSSDGEKTSPGVGVSPEQFVEQLNAYGEVELVRDWGAEEVRGKLRKKDVLSIYTIRTHDYDESGRFPIRPLTITPPKGRVKRLFHRLSN